MFTIKKIDIERNYGIRQEGYSSNENIVWCVKKGESYALVRFVFNEVPTHYYWTSVAMDNRLTDEQIEKEVRESICTIPEESLRWFKNFIESGNKFGWD